MELQETEEKKNWFKRLRSGLSRSSSKVGGGISAIFTRKRLDEETLEELEELLISADLGVQTASRLTQVVRKTKVGKDVTDQEVKEILAHEIEKTLSPFAQDLQFDQEDLQIIVSIGVNGVGKTTTLGKLAKRESDRGKKVMLVAGDTFRAAAVEQLQIWGERIGAPVMHVPYGQDPSGLVYSAVEEAQKEGIDLLFIDTAGRLHNKDNLMQELQKIVRVIQKIKPDQPQEILLVLDATTGQNAYAQVKAFQEMVSVTGLIVTKLDGTAKGGVIVGLAEQAKLPVYALGVGEKLEDLRSFEPSVFARALVGLDEEES